MLHEGFRARSRGAGPAHAARAAVLAAATRWGRALLCADDANGAITQPSHLRRGSCARPDAQNAEVASKIKSLARDIRDRQRSGEHAKGRAPS